MVNVATVTYLCMLFLHLSLGWGHCGHGQFFWDIFAFQTVVFVCLCCQCFYLYQELLCISFIAHVYMYFRQFASRILDTAVLQNTFMHFLLFFLS